jgi:hypothetical protein
MVVVEAILPLVVVKKTVIIPMVDADRCDVDAGTAYGADVIATPMSLHPPYGPFSILPLGVIAQRLPLSPWTKKNSWPIPSQHTAGAAEELTVAGVAALATPAIETSMMAARAILTIQVLNFIIIHLAFVGGACASFANLNT